MITYYRYIRCLSVAFISVGSALVALKRALLVSRSFRSVLITARSAEDHILVSNNGRNNGRYNRLRTSVRPLTHLNGYRFPL